MSFLRTRGIRADAGAEVLFADVELEIAAGDRICLTGRNGAGEVHPPRHSRRPPRAGRGVSRAGAGTRGRPPPPDPAHLPGRPRARNRGRRLSGRNHDGRLGPGLEGRACPRGSRHRAGSHLRVVVGWTETTCPAGPGDGRGAGHPPSRRADEPSRSSRHRVARAGHRELPGRSGVHDPRPDLSAPGGESHRRDRPGSRDVVAGRLRQLSAAARRALGGGGARGETVRPASRVGGSVDPPQSRGATRPQHGQGPPAAGNAAGPRGPAGIVRTAPTSGSATPPTNVPENARSKRRGSPSAIRTRRS